MVAMATPPPGTRSKSRPVKRPVETLKVPITVKPSAEERGQLRKDRISAVVAVLLIVGLMALGVWVAITGDASNTDAMWDYPYM
ncbi:MAG: hypothetical protein ACI93T_001149 [Porticoccaceae bacterium]|jgi:hypothetical protein